MLTAALRRAYLWLPPRPIGKVLFQVPLRLRGRRVLTRRLVRSVRRVGLPVQAWIVDEPADMTTILEWGVTGLISDRPDVAIAIGRRRISLRPSRPDVVTPGPLNLLSSRSQSASYYLIGAPAIDVVRASVGCICRSRQTFRPLISVDPPQLRSSLNRACSAALDSRA